MTRIFAVSVLAAVVALTGCTTDDQGAGASTAAPTSVAEATSAPQTTPAAQTTSTSGQSDESLADMLTKVTINGKPLEPFPVATVRKANTASLPAVVPQSCGFAATGLLSPILEGRPAAMALTDARINVTMVDMGTPAGASELVAQRDHVLDSPECRTLTVNSQGQPVTAAISEKKVGRTGLEDARVLISTSTVDGRTISSATLLGRKGSVLVLVSNAISPDVTPIEQVAGHLANELP